MGCVLFDRQNNHNYGLITVNQNDYNRFLNEQTNNLFTYDRNINRNNNNNNTYNENNNNRNHYDTNHNHRNNNRNYNNINFRINRHNNNRNASRNNNNRNNRNRSYGSLTNNEHNYSFENNIHNNRNNRNINTSHSRNNIIENGSYFFIPSLRNNDSNLNSNNRRRRRLNFLRHSIEPRVKRGSDSNKKHPLQNFNEIIIKDLTKLEEGKKKCTICLENFKSNIKIISLPCLHFFHNSCIAKWIKIKKYCPICQFELTRENLIEKNNLLTTI